MLSHETIPLALRTRIVGFVNEGGSKTEAASRFKTSRMTVYRYCNAAKEGGLAPKPQGGSPKRFADEALREDVEARPSATLKERAAAFGVHHNAIWKRLRALKITLKKTPEIPREGRGSEGAVHRGVAGACPPVRPRVLPRRERD